MWIDEEGVAHTVALPDPTRVMSEDFLASLDALTARERGALLSVVEQAEMHAYERDWSDLRESEIYIGAPAPADLLCGYVITPDEVARAIQRVAPRWPLDAILALGDYLDE